MDFPENDVDAPQATTIPAKETYKNRLIALECDDGTENVEFRAEKHFLNWLRQHGAKVDKLDWPSRETVSGVRGAVALKDIHPMEPMLEIPLKCMIYPKVCYECPELANVYKDHVAFFSSDDDIVISLFLMHEKLKGEDSFWHPYLAILPRPGGIGEWSEEEQLYVQDRMLVGEARRRPNQLRLIYDQIIRCLLTTDPNQFSAENYTFELFNWAWMTVQSRAFGRRLEWTAMVPFADCLNHTNVQTKYDLHVEHLADFEHHEELKHDDIVGDTFFRLYPSGTNSYMKGTEAFNSYGRRSNKFLLLEYGFCLEGNEWDTYELCVRVPSTVSNYEKKCEILRNMRLGRVKLFKLEKKKLNRELLAYLRIVFLPEERFLEEEGTTDYDEEDNRRSRLSGTWFNPITVKHELTVLEELTSLLEAEISRQETSLEHDLQLLKEESIPPRKKAALLYRIERKKILVSQVQLVSTAKEKYIKALA